MSYKKSFMLVFLILFASSIMIFIVNSNRESVLLSAFLLSLPVIVIYMKVYVRIFTTTFFFLVFYLMLFYTQPIYNLMVEYHYYQYQFDEMKKMTLLSVLGALLFCIGNCIFSTKARLNLEKIYITPSSVKKAVGLLGVMTLVFVGICFLDARTLNVLNLSRLELKNTGSPLRLAATYGFYLTSIMFFLVFFTLQARRKSNVIKWVVIFVLLEITIFLLFRTRSLMVVHSSAVLVGYYYSYLYGYNKKVKTISTKFVTVTFCVILFIVAITSRFLRGHLQPGQSVGNFDFDFKTFLEMSVMSGDIGYTNTVLDVVNYVPQYADFLSGQSYYRLIFVFVPRFIWSDKPENTERIVASWLAPGVEGQTIPPGIIGDAYINFGLIGISVMLIVGLFFSYLDKKVNVGSFMMWGVSSTWIFHFVRGGFTNPLLIFFTLYFAVLFMHIQYFNKNSGGKIDSREREFAKYNTLKSDQN